MAQQPFQATQPQSEPVGPMTARTFVASRKQDFNIYTVMLLMSLVFLLVGTILMWIELGRYEGGATAAWKTGDATPRSGPAVGAE